jgi:hypothetical protein
VLVSIQLAVMLTATTLATITTHRGWYAMHPGRVEARRDLQATLDDFDVRLRRTAAFSGWRARIRTGLPRVARRRAASAPTLPGVVMRIVCRLPRSRCQGRSGVRRRPGRRRRAGSRRRRNSRRRKRGS